jgi:hypothetical protein
MKGFYFLFNPNPDNFASWVQGGYTRGFIALLGISLLTTIIYYLILGKINGKYSKNGKWFLFMLLNCLIVFIASVAFINSVIPSDGINSIMGIAEDVWFFSLLNGTLYAIFIYFILSLLLNNFSLYSKYIPFNLFKSK